ncbi:hypothetical protein [Bacillus sp. Brlt_9]|uniref:hypothetical protein n=1 Tax=Bacillus sp. Brlt_9 TaxID=3110916 RepID=UPI003F7C8812
MNKYIIGAAVGLTAAALAYKYKEEIKECCKDVMCACSDEDYCELCFHKEKHAH